MYFSFQVNLAGSTKEYRFHDADRAEKVRAHFSRGDARFAPSDIARKEQDRSAVIIEPHNRNVDTDTSGLVFVGAHRRMHSYDKATDRAWFAPPDRVEQVRREFETVTKRDSMFEIPIPQNLIREDMKNIDRLISLNDAAASVSDQSAEAKLETKKPSLR